ncbi:MAG: hypothetical protein LBM66_07565, partial [Bifidobacteriaceae bacterium]|nr:hypothetical protein [Bifidobacteriaceae bacterium]
RRGAVSGPGTDESYITVRVHGSGAGGGEPRAGLAVTATGGGLRTEATTGSLGCAILMVTPGSGTEYTVRVSGQKDGFPYLTQRGLDQAVSVVTVAGPGGANAADLQIDGFDPAGRLSIIVAGATAATNAVLVVSDDAGGPEPMSLPVNGGGQLAPVYLPPGRYELEVNGTNWQTPVQVTSGEQQSVVLDASAVTGG